MTNKFDEIYANYCFIDLILEKKEDEATNNRDFKVLDEIKKNRTYNNHAYFLFLFARLEDCIKEVSTTLINIKQSSSQWQDKRGWDILSSRRLGRLDLKKRAALLIEKGRNDYNDFEELYKLRNKIAHEGMIDATLSIPRIVSTIRKLYNVITLNFPSNPSRSN